MYGILDLQFWLAFFFFFIAIIITFYIPGLLIANKLFRKPSVSSFFIAICLGYFLWSAQGYIFGYLHMRWMSYFYIFLSLIFFYKNRILIKEHFAEIRASILRNRLLTIALIVGVIFQSQIMFGSGFITNDGAQYLGVNNVDGIMHLGYIQEMMQYFPPNEPGAYLLPLKNYHYWMDLNIAELARIWKLPEYHIFYQFMPLIFSIVTAALAYLLMRIWTGSRHAGVWALFFLFFGGDATYLFMLTLHKMFGFYTPIIDNGMTQFYNMPHAAAKMIFFASLITFYYWIKTQKNKWGITTVLLFTSLVGFKIYFGIFAAFGMVLVVAGKIIQTFIKLKKSKTFLQRVKTTFIQQKISIGLIGLFAIIAAIIYFPPNSGAGGLVYKPMEWPKIFLSPQNLDIREWWLRMQVYEQAGNIRNIVILNAFAILVTLICIYGTRLIGFIPHKNLIKKLGWEHMLFIMPGIIVFNILGFTTLQEAGSFNIYNFFVVSSIFFSLFAGYLLYELMLKKKWWAYLLICIIVILTVPRAINENYIAAKTILTKDGSLLSNAELEGLEYIKNHTPKDAIIQPHPNNEWSELTTYVAYFTNRHVYVSGNKLIESHIPSINNRVDELDIIFKAADEITFVESLTEKKISYLYLRKDENEKLPIVVSEKYFEKIFENDEVKILHIKSNK